MTQEVKSLLVELARRYETEAFLDGDPSCFMHRVAGTLNQEATAFVAAALSFGSRPQFLKKVDVLLAAASNDMDAWIRSGGFERCPELIGDGPFYRFFDRPQMRRFLSAYKGVMDAEGSLGEAVRRRSPSGALDAIKTICGLFNGTGVIPACPASACKRLCMFLRWMVRSGSPVDLGLWSDFIGRETLIMPLDVHVMRQSHALGLMDCSSASMSAARRLTDTLADVFPGDPLKGDFALFGLGVDASHNNLKPPTHN